MEFPVLVEDVIYDVFRLVNYDAIISLDDGQVEQFEVIIFLKGVINHGIKLLLETGETISVLESKYNALCFNKEDVLVVVMGPREGVLVQKKCRYFTVWQILTSRHHKITFLQV